MDDSTTIERLTKAIGEATKSAKFCVSGTLPDVNPGIEIEGLGGFDHPAGTGVGQAACGLVSGSALRKGDAETQTLVNTKVRKTFELDPNQHQSNDCQFFPAIARFKRKPFPSTGFGVFLFALFSA